jgi:Ca2+-transporting ATPase
MSTWYSKEAGEVLRGLQSRETGLATSEGERRLKEYGPNQIRRGEREGLLRRFFAQMKDPMILVLLAAAVLSVATGGGEDLFEAGIILLIVLVNAVISIAQEDHAHKALEALEQLAAPQARVMRDGVECRLDAAALVPGDIILLEAGDYVPADARLLRGMGLQVDESAMTGESVPVSKDASKLLPPGTPLGDRINMLLAATVVTAGRGSAVVTATGMETEVGRIAGLLLRQETGDTPLQRRMGEISKALSFICLSVCALLFGVGLLQQRPMLDMLMTAVSLAVAAIPEGLPAVVTIVLAIGVQRLARHNAIVKKLPAVETLGCASVICSDKTGTLTQNRMTIVEVWPPETALRREVLTLGALCNDAKLLGTPGQAPTLTGDPTEKAFLALAMEEGIRKEQLERDMPRRGELPFDSTRKRMSTLHPLPGGGWRLAVKGAPEVVLARCTHRKTARGVVPMSAAEAEGVFGRNEAMAARALRVLAVAYRDYPQRPHSMEEEGLTFVGLAGMIDPPRPEVREAVARCYAAGIRPVMITGDHRETAVAIARELDIYRPGDLAITGEGLDFLPQEQLEEDIHLFAVFARVTPEHKMRIVQAWQKRGCVVAMTGDGVNDAPALKAADIGCAMGISGTDVAKGAADMILMDDNFTSVVRAVEQGRGIYANIKKATHYLLSCNIGEMLTISVATLCHFTHMPLYPVQLLWLNLVTDSLPALALGMEPVEEDVMEQKPRDTRENFFNKRFSLRLLWQGLMVGGLTLLAYGLGYFYLGGPGVANTMAFATLTLSQLCHAFDVRSETRSLLHMGIFSNGAMNKAFVVGLVLQMGVLCYPPLMALFSVVPLDRAEWLTVWVLALSPLVICEIVKAFRRMANTRGRIEERFHEILKEKDKKGGRVRL